MVPLGIGRGTGITGISRKSSSQMASLWAFHSSWCYKISAWSEKTSGWRGMGRSRDSVGCLVLVSLDGLRSKGPWGGDLGIPNQRKALGVTQETLEVQYRLAGFGMCDFTISGNSVFGISLGGSNWSQNEVYLSTGFEPPKPPATNPRAGNTNELVKCQNFSSSKANQGNKNQRQNRPSKKTKKKTLQAYQRHYAKRHC